MGESNTILSFGAGSIGRGLMGQLAEHARYRTVFVEPVASLREALVAEGSYCVHLTGRQRESFRVSDFEVVSPEDMDALAEHVARCSFAVTAVGGAHLKSVATLLAAGLAGRKRALPILLCENWPAADTEMFGYLREAGAREGDFLCVPASVERMVRSGEGLDLIGESCETLYADGSKWRESRPRIAGLCFVDDLTPYYKRKLFTNNAGHVLLAYRGALRGYALLRESVADREIRKALEEFLAVASSALHREYGLPLSTLKEHCATLMQYRFPNEELADTVRRVGRAPLRKLGPHERLIGLLRLVDEHHLDLAPICDVIAAALHYHDPEDEECRCMRGMIEAAGVQSVLREICALEPECPASKTILRAYMDFENG